MMDQASVPIRKFVCAGRGVLRTSESSRTLGKSRFSSVASDFAGRFTRLSGSERRDRHTRRGFLPLDRHGESADRQVGTHAIAHRPLHDLSREEIERDGEIEPPSAGIPRISAAEPSRDSPALVENMGNVGKPNLSRTARCPTLGPHVNQRANPGWGLLGLPSAHVPSASPMEPSRASSSQSPSPPARNAHPQGVV